MKKNKKGFEKKIEAIILEYESMQNLGEYAKGRLSAYKTCLEILKNK